MIRFIFKLLALILVLAVIYGFWLLYQDQTPEARRSARERVFDAFGDASRLAAEALRRTYSRIVSSVAREDPAASD